MTVPDIRECLARCPTPHPSSRPTEGSGGISARSEREVAGSGDGIPPRRILAVAPVGMTGAAGGEIRRITTLPDFTAPAFRNFVRPLLQRLPSRLSVNGIRQRRPSSTPSPWGKSSGGGVREPRRGTGIEHRRDAGRPLPRSKRDSAGESLYFLIYPDIPAHNAEPWR